LQPPNDIGSGTDKAQPELALLTKTIVEAKEVCAPSQTSSFNNFFNTSFNNFVQ
jgi:hypothetical protein